MLPPDYSARCTDCRWSVSTPDRAYRDRLVTQHKARYAHIVIPQDLTS